jgi:hypothetical protein
MINQLSRQWASSWQAAAATAALFARVVLVAAVFVVTLNMDCLVK